MERRGEEDVVGWELLLALLLLLFLILCLLLLLLLLLLLDILLGPFEGRKKVSSFSYETKENEDLLLQQTMRTRILRSGQCNMLAIPLPSSVVCEKPSQICSHFTSSSDLERVLLKQQLTADGVKRSIMGLVLGFFVILSNLDHTPLPYRIMWEALV